MVRLDRNKLLGFRLDAASRPAMQAKIGENGEKAPNGRKSTAASAKVGAEKAPASGRPVAAGAKIGNGSKKPVSAGAKVGISEKGPARAAIGAKIGFDPKTGGRSARAVMGAKIGGSKRSG